MLELERIYSILVSFLGESKQGRYDSSNTQYQFNCPFCAEEEGDVDGKYNFEVSLELLVYKCWKCEHSGSLSRLIKKYGGRDALREYHEAAESLKNSKYYSLSDDEKKILERETKRLVLPKTFTKINLSTCRDRRLAQYLKKRRIDQKIINRFKIGYCEWSQEPDERPWSNRLIIPSYDDSGVLNFFVGRDFLPDKKEHEPGTFIRPKYKNCDAEKNDIIFQESLIDWDADIILVEGAIDCIYGPNTISMLGKTMDENTALFKKLRAKSTAKVILCLDGDVDDLQIEKLCNLLYYGGIGDRTYYIDMKRDIAQYKDFGEIFEAEGRRGIIMALRKMKQYNGQNIW